MALHPKAKASADRIVNEVRTFFRAADGLFATPPEAVDSQIYLDAFLVHYRLLFGFFRTEGKGDDCVAEHFMSDESWKETKRKLFARSIEVGQVTTGRLRLDKVQDRLNCLTYQQLDQAVEWPIAEIIADTYEAWDSFLDSLQPIPRSLFPVDELPEIAACKQTISNVAD